MRHPATRLLIVLSALACLTPAFAQTPPMAISPGAPTPVGPTIAPVAPPAATVSPAPAVGLQAPPAPEVAPVYPTPQQVNAATFIPGAAIDLEQPNALVLKLQILLDRAGFSPGVIDGYGGRNVTKAVQVTESILGLPTDGALDAELWAALATSQGMAVPALVGYIITAEDLAGPFYPKLPSDYAELAKLDRAGYRTPLEMFAERFHMNEKLLAALNPGIAFNQPGTTIVVAAVGGARQGPPVASLVADKKRAQLFGFDAAGKLVVAYPATIGSVDMPSPSGTHQVNAIARNAAYYYRPDVNFVQGNNHDQLTIPPGPNNPIGTTWIDLTEPTYGIHGTPEPAQIDKTNSHGCVRLTNWDIEELAGLVKKGVPVEFR